MAKTTKNPTTKTAKHNINVTVIEVNQPSDAAVAEFNRLLNKFAAKLAKTSAKSAA